MELEKNLEINFLINLYGNLLTDKQLIVLKNYYYYDNSLSEIADEQKISRQAVSDLINRTVKTLYTYESKLKLLSKYKNIMTQIDDLKENNSDKKQIKVLNKIIEILED